MQGQIVLPRQLPAAGVEAGGEVAGGIEIVYLVPGLAEAQAGSPAPEGAKREGPPRHLLDKIALILKVAVKLVVALRPQQEDIQGPAGAEVVAAPGVDGKVVIAIRIGLVNPEETRDGLLGVDPLGIEPGRGGAVVEVSISAANPAGDLFRAIRAAARIQAVARALARALAGEDVNDAPQGLRPPQAGTGAANHLDALYLGGRQMLEGRDAQGGGTQPDPVYQHQHMVGLGAANANARDFAIAAAGGDINASHPLQQFRQGMDLQGLNVRPLQHRDGGGQFVFRHRDAGAGHDDLLGVRQVAGRGASLGARRLQTGNDAGQQRQNNELFHFFTPAECRATGKAAAQTDSDQ